MHLTSILIAYTLIRCQVSTIEMHDLVQEFKDEKDGIISSLNLNYENSLLNPMIGEPYKHTGLISNLRFFGPGIIPGSIAKTTQRSYPNDKSNHPLIQFIIKLFPSPAGTLNHFCTHANHLTKLFVEINSTDKIENASDLLVCSITGERFEYSNKGHEECIKRLKEEKAKLENGIDKNEVEAINEKIFNMTTEKTGIEKNLRVLNKQMGSIRKNTIVYTDIELESLKDNIKESQDKLKRLKGELEGFKKTLSELLESKGIEELNKKIKLNQEIEEKRKSAFEDLGTAMSKALKNKKFLNPQLLLPMIIHEFVKSAFKIGELKEYMHKSLIKIEKKVSEKSEILDRLRVLNTDVDWADALVKIYLTNNTFPYSKFNLPVSNISIPSYIRGKDGEEEQFDENNLFADCAEIAIMQLCNCLLFNPKYKICELSHLGNAKLEPELKDFYQKYSNPFASTTLEKRNDWSKVVQDRRDLVKPDDNDFQTHWIIYNRDNRNEIYPGLINMMSVIALIFGIDRKAIFDGLDEGNILERLKVLLKAVAIPGMSVEIDKANSDTLKSSVINSRSHSRTEFFGKVNINFSYKDDRENESRTTMSIKHKESHTAFNFVQNNSKEIDLSNEIALLGDSSGFKEFSFPSMISRVFLMAGNNPLPKGNVLEDMYASGLVESNEKKLEMLETVYENMLKDRNQEETGIFNSETPEGTNDREDFIRIIDSIVENVPLEDPEVFYSFAPFLLHSGKYKNKLNGMDLRLVYESNNENLSEHWIKYADERVGTLRCSFDIDEIDDDESLKKIEFCKNFSKLTDVELFCSRPYSFDKSLTWSNSMKVLTEIPTYTEVELNTNNLAILKDFIDGAASNSEVLQQLIRLKIVFDDDSGIRYINSAVGKFPSLVTSLPNLSEITIENQATTYTPGEDTKSDNLVKLIEELPTDRDIAIKLIGRFIESNERPEFVNALKENQKFVNALKKTPDTVKVSIVYNLYSFNKFDAFSLRDTIEDPKLNIRIFNTSNGIERKIPNSIAFLDNLLKVEYFHIWFNTKIIEVKHTTVKDFPSSLDPFLKEWKCEWKCVEYTDENPRTEICELLEFVKGFKTFNTCKSIRFKSNFLDLSNEKERNHFILVVNEPNKELKLDVSALLIDFENFIPFYKKMQGKRSFTLKVNSWLIRVRKGNMGAFILQLPKTYNMEFHEIRQENEFLEKIKALSELDCFKPDFMNTNVLYVEDGNFNTVFQMLKTIKIRFEKVFIAEKLFSTYQFYKIRAELRKGGTCKLEIVPKELLLTP
ncbi:hypothetical protein GINT2_001443 [Glugoides intestinalis]